MKKYKIEYLKGDVSKPCVLSELAKSGREEGEVVEFWNNGGKFGQDKIKNGLLNGIAKGWGCFKLHNIFFCNYKKDKTHGISIKFKT